MSSTSLGSRLASVAVAALALAGCGVIGVLPASGANCNNRKHQWIFAGFERLCRPVRNCDGEDD